MGIQYGTLYREFQAWLGVALLLAACSEPGYIQIRTKEGAGIYDLPAGDTVELAARLWSKSGAVTRSVPMSPGRKGFDWSIQYDSDAAVLRGSTLYTRKPGGVRVVASARGVAEILDIHVVWPVDSIVFGFVSPTIRVGDTVEVLHRAHYRTGEVEVRGYGGFEGGDTAQSRGADGKYPGPGWTSHSNDLPAHQWQPPEPRLGDTLLYVGERPGRFRIGAFFQAHWHEDTLTVLPAEGRTPKSYRQQRDTMSATPRPTWLGCYTLSFGRWQFGIEPTWPDNWPPPRELYGYVPTAIAFDSITLVPGYPESGRRLDAARGPVLRAGRRWWRTTDNGVRIAMWQARGGDWPNASSISMSLTFSAAGTILSGIATDDERRAPVKGVRIPCQP